MPRNTEQTIVYDEDGNEYRLNYPISPKRKAAEPVKEKKTTKATKKITKTSKKTAKKAATKKAVKKVVKKVVAKKLTQRVADEERLTDEQLREKKEKEEYRHYRQCKKVVKEYEKKQAEKEWNALPEWKKADKWMTKAASIRSRYHKLLTTNMQGQEYLPNAIPGLKNKGETLFKQAMDIVNNLSEQDKKLFWMNQERNIDAKCFDDLVCITEYENAKQQITNAMMSNATGQIHFDGDDDQQTEEPTGDQPVEEQPMEAEPVQN